MLFCIAGIKKSVKPWEIGLDFLTEPLKGRTSHNLGDEVVEFSYKKIKAM